MSPLLGESLGNAQAQITSPCVPYPTCSYPANMSVTSMEAHDDELYHFQASRIR